jgi:hypothetical protein
MGRKLPPYFVKAQPGCPCDGCDQVKSTCRFCELCYDCCVCSPQYICPFCHGYETCVSRDSDIAKELEECRCEPCVGCGKHINRDDGNYLPDDYRPYCLKCYNETPISKR